MKTGLPRMSVQQRLQHGLFALAVTGALASGWISGRPAGSGEGLRSWHALSGFAALALLGYHLLYLAVRGYVEASGWSALPLRWARGDREAAAAEIAFLAGRAPARPDAGEYRVSQKLFYWWCVVGTAALVGTGVTVMFWERLGTLEALATLADAHSGLALVLLATCLWHLYGVLVWDGRWWPEWSWVSGTLDADKARRKVPGAWDRHVAEGDELAATAGMGAPEEQVRARQVREKEEVQAELEQGNRLALEERYVEALHHYRRALELYPGYSQALYNMARVLQRMGEREMAVERYRQFLAADPFHPLARRAQTALRELAGEGDPG